MAHIKVTVNGRPVDMWIEEDESREKSNEVQAFLQAEMRGFRKTCRRPSVSAPVMKNHTRVYAAANNSIRFA